MAFLFQKFYTYCKYLPGYSITKAQYKHNENKVELKKCQLEPLTFLRWAKSKLETAEEKISECEHIAI